MRHDVHFASHGIGSEYDANVRHVTEKLEVEAAVEKREDDDDTLKEIQRMSELASINTTRTI
jgi:hypothetical protein